MANQLADIPILARSAIEHEQFFDLVLSYFQGDSRKNRQHAASVFDLIATDKPEKLIPIIPVFIDALERPEAQTRWCSLEVIEKLTPLAPEACLEAFDGAEVALFDEKHGFLREKAFSLLCTLGSLSIELSDKVWPLLDEAIQCYHGEPEFIPMLNRLQALVAAGMSDEAKAQLKDRLAFDAKSGRGSLGKHAQQISEML